MAAYVIVQALPRSCCSSRDPGAARSGLQLRHFLLACSFDISFNSHFEPGADRLPASEVRRLAEWMIDDPAAFENKKEFHILVYEAPAVGVSHALARKRVSHLEHWLTTFGVPVSMISMEIPRYKPGKSAEPPNFAHINFMPGCPHPCCPGPEPTWQIR